MYAGPYELVNETLESYVHDLPTLNTTIDNSFVCRARGVVVSRFIRIEEVSGSIPDLATKKPKLITWVFHI